ncbi:hypothetical protein F4776DRAFT_666774 [Hypoxylon sp. NC0597]|nr:hypothetical protein F4776DRAFT_666774 [Hypoxylon sp. NC0597]
MHFSTTLNFAAAVVPVLFQSVSGWSFTMYDVAGCQNSTLSAIDEVEKTGNVACDPVPNANRHKSVQGAIPAGSECRISFYPSEGCGDRVAFSLTQYTTTCLSIEDFIAPLAYYKATDCE